MKKTLIALTLASLPMAASAEVVLYGKIKGGVEVSKNFTNPDVFGLTNVKKGTSTKIVDYSSRIGFKGAEDLNNNLRAIWQVEQDVSIGGKDTGFSTRDSFIGLAGNFGTAKAGYLSTPVKDVNGRLDEWEYSDSAAGLDTYTRSNAAVKRAGAISYETPNFGGFTAQAYVSPSDNNNSNSTSWTSFNNEKDSAIYGAKASYENAGFFGDIAGTYVKNSAYAPNGKDGYQAVVNAGYDANNWLAGVSYQQGRYVDDIATLLDAKHDNASVTASNLVALGYNSNDNIKRIQEVTGTVAYTLNNNLRLKGSAGYGFNIDSQSGLIDNAKYVQGIVGADYLLSKRTALNGQVGYLEFKDKNNDVKLKKGTVGVGMSHKF